MKVVLPLLMAVWATASHASLVTYTYQGSGYEFFLEPDGSPWSSNPYSDATQKFITGSITLDTDFLPGGTNKNVSYFASAYEFALGCNTPGCSGTAIYDYSFFDGVLHTGVTATEDHFVAWQDFTLETDALGNLVSWKIDLDGDPNALFISSRSGDARRLASCVNEELDYICVRNRTPGQWTQLPVSEPGTLALAFAGLAGLWYLRRPRMTARSRPS